MAIKVITPDRYIATVKTVVDFITEIEKVAPTGSSENVFRGQRNHTWLSKPGILRASEKVKESERELIKELMSVHPQEFKDDSGMFDRLVRMQHFGLPTRLLDVSLNPLVALYFATEPHRSRSENINGEVFIYTVPKQRRKYYDSDAVACIANLANLSADERKAIVSYHAHDIGKFNGEDEVIRLLQFIKEEKAHFRSVINPNHLFVPYFVVPKMNNRRIIAQSGAFIIYGLERNMKRKINPAIQVKVIKIPQDAKSPIRQQLEKIGINESTLFPELDKAASYIVKRFS